MRGWLASTPEGRRPQIRGFHAGGSLAVASSTPATQLLSPAKLLKLNHAAKTMWGRPRISPIRQVARAGPVEVFVRSAEVLARDAVVFENVRRRVDRGPQPVYGGPS